MNGKEMDKSTKEEYLLTPEHDRYNVFPIQNPKIWEMY